MAYKRRSLKARVRAVSALAMQDEVYAGKSRTSVQFKMEHRRPARRRRARVACLSNGRRGSFVWSLMRKLERSAILCRSVWPNGLNFREGENGRAKRQT